MRSRAVDAARSRRAVGVRPANRPAARSAEQCRAVGARPRMAPRRKWVRSVKAVSQSSVRQAIDAFGRGEIIVVTDDDDRENEGDLIIAAAHATPEKIAFIIRHTAGIVCAPITGETARRLHLAP